MVNKVTAAAASFRYWRIYVTALNSPGQLAIYEVELRGAVGGADLTTPSTPVLASSFVDNGEDGAYPGTATIDNDPTFSFWLTTLDAPPHWIRYDMATARAVVQVAINATGSASQCPRDFIVQGSTNGTTFTDVKSFSGVNTWTGWQAFTL